MNIMKKKIIAAIVCFVLFWIYQILAVVVFGWENGGGTLPLAILMAVLVFVWKTIVNYEGDGE